MVIGLRIKLFDIEVYIEFSFLLMLSFALLLGSNDICYLLLFSSLHELGHLLSLYLVGGKAKSLKLSYYGLALKYDSELNRYKETIVLISGPVVNLFCYLLFRDDINLLLLILNSLPIYPIDLGRIIRLYSYKLSKILSFIFVIILFVLSVYLLIKNHSISLLFITCYLIIYSINY